MTDSDIKDLFNLAIMMNSVSRWLHDEQPSDEATSAIEAVRVEARDLMTAANTFLEG